MHDPVPNGSCVVVAFRSRGADLGPGGHVGISKVNPVRVLFTVFLGVALSLVLSGCGLGGATTADTTPAPTTTDEVVLVPTDVDFGTVAIKTTAKVPLKLTNPGKQALTVLTVDITGSAFAVTNLALPLSIPAGSTYTANVTFSPTMSGANTGSATITTDKSNGNGKKIGLLGNGGTSKLDASPTAVSFGSLAVGKTTTKVVSITNSGNAALKITAASVSNASFATTDSTWVYPVTIAAGSSKNLNVTYAPKAAGSATGTVTFTSDATSGTSTVSLSGTATTAGQLAASPGAISFGSVGVGTVKTQLLTLTNTGGNPVIISSMTSTDAPVTITGPTMPATVAVGASVDITVRWAPTTAGALSAGLAIINDGATSPFAIAVSGTGVAPSLSASPTSFSFGSINTGSTATNTLTLTNNGTVSVTVSSVTATGAAFTVTGFTLPATLAAGQSVAGTVSFKPTAAGSATGSVAVSSNASPLNIPLSGSGVAVAPVAAITPTSVAFGNVKTGTTQSRAVTIQNTGNANLVVSGVAATGAGFSVTGFTLPLTLAPGTSANGSVTFAPTAAGNTSGSVTVTSNAPGASSALSGTGIQPVLTVTPTSLAFSSVTTGTTSTQPLTLRNSGTATLTVSQLSVTGAGFSVTGFTLPLTLAPGANVAGSVRFAPTTAGAVTGSVTPTSDSAVSVAPVALSGTGVLATPQITVTPTSIAFGSITTGNSTTSGLTLKNTGTADLNISAITASGAGYSISGFILPLTLAPGASAVGNVVFAPTTTGALNGSVAIASNSATAAPTVTLTGSGVAPATFLLSVSPTSLTFGSVLVGNSSTLPVTLTNNGTGAISVTAGNVIGTGYSLTGATFPLSIAAGASRSVNVVFTPQISGAANGTASFVSNATNSPASVTMTGSGQAPVPHFVDLSWNASTSSGINGYHIYRSSTSGGAYSLLNNTLQSGTSYTDSTVLSGRTYFYMVRAVHTTGTESPDSNVASAAIPTP
jgi:hypothetical protein